MRQGRDKSHRGSAISEVDLTAGAVVVVNYGSSRLLAGGLAQLSRSAPELLVIVVDNFTDESERRNLQGLADCEGWSTVMLESNTGFGAATNLGVERARDEGRTWYILLNPDAMIDRGNLLRLAARVAGDQLVLAAPIIVRPDGSVWFDGADLYLADGRIRSARRRPAGDLGNTEPWLSGACLAVSDRLWNRVGGFDPTYFLYWEDVDLSWRVVRAGGQLICAEDALVVHDEGGTQVVGGTRRHRGKSSGYYYFNIRNRMLFAVKWLDREGVDRWRRSDLTVGWAILLQGGRRQFFHTLTPWWAAIRGIRDGRVIARDGANAMEAACPASRRLGARRPPKR